MAKATIKSVLGEDEEDNKTAQPTMAQKVKLDEVVNAAPAGDTAPVRPRVVPVEAAPSPDVVNYGQGRVVPADVPMNTPAPAPEQQPAIQDISSPLVPDEKTAPAPAAPTAPTTDTSKRSRIAGGTTDSTVAQTGWRPPNYDQLEASRVAADEAQKKPVNKDHGVRGFLKELLENTLWGIAETRRQNPQAGVWELLAGGGAAGGIGAFKRDFNELRGYDENRARAQEEYTRQQKIADDYFGQYAKGEQLRIGDERLRQQAFQRETALKQATARLEQGDTKMWLDYINRHGFDPQKDTYIAEQLAKKGIQLDATAGQSQPRVWSDGALLERDPKTGGWTFALDNNGQPVFSQGKSLVPVNTMYGTFLLPQGQAGAAAIAGQTQTVNIANKQTAEQMQADYEYETAMQRHNAEVGKLIGDESAAQSEIDNLNKQISKLDPKTDWDGSKRRELEQKLSIAQGKYNSAFTQVQMKIENPPVRRTVPNYQVNPLTFGNPQQPPQTTPPGVPQGAKQVFTRQQVVDRVKAKFPNLKEGSPEFSAKVDDAIKKLGSSFISDEQAKKATVIKRKK